MEVKAPISELPIDAGQIDLAQASPRAFPPVISTRKRDFPVVFRQSVLNEIRRHGEEFIDREICGVLVGNLYRDDDRPYLYIEASIRGEYASNESCNVTFTAETWEHIQGVMERQHTSQRIVGWYHTHPGFDIFLSDMDLFIHGNFFNLPWQVAYVYDPQKHEEGLFVWREGKTNKEPYLVESDVAAMEAQPATSVFEAGGSKSSRSIVIAIVATVVAVAAAAVGLSIFLYPG